MTAKIDLPYSGYPEYPKVISFAQTLIDKVAALPGTERVAIGANPLMLATWQISFVREGLMVAPGQERNADTDKSGQTANDLRRAERGSEPQPFDQGRERRGQTLYE